MARSPGTATFTLGVDNTAPSVQVANAPAAPVSGTTFVLQGTATDALSGLRSLTCAGVKATLTASTFQCGVQLAGGAMSVPVVATDRAGAVMAMAGTARRETEAVTAALLPARSRAVTATVLAPFASATLAVNVPPAPSVALTPLTTTEAMASLSLAVPVMVIAGAFVAAAGGASSATSGGTASFAIDSSIVVTFVQPADGSTLAEGAVVRVKADVRDGGTINHIALWTNDRLFSSSTQRTMDIRYRVPPGLSEVAALMQATDFDGLRGQSQTVRYPVVGDTIAPTVQITSPSGTSIAGGQTIAVTATATDNAVVAAVELFANGVSIGLGTAPPYSAPYFVPESGLATVTFTATATDGAGNSATSAPVTLTVLGDQPPTARITEPLTGAGLYAGGEIVIDSIVTDDIRVNRLDYLVNGERADETGWDDNSDTRRRITLPTGVTRVTLVAEVTDSRGQVALSPEVILDLRPTSILSSIPLGGFPFAVEVQGSHAYVPASAAGLRVIDISDPAAPFIAGSATFPQAARGLALGGQYAFVPTEKGPVQVVDVSAPANPTVVGSVAMDVPARSATLHGEHLFVTSELGLHIFDVRNPLVPRPVTVLESERTAWSVAFAGSSMFVIADSHTAINSECRRCSRITAYDITHIAAPVRLSELAVEAREQDIGARPVVDGDRLYISGEDYIAAVDISDPSNLSEIAKFDEVWWYHCCWKDVKLHGGLLFAGTDEMRDSGIQIIDASDPENLQIIGTFDTSSLGRWNPASGLAVTPELVYGATSDGRPFRTPQRDLFVVGRYRTIQDNLAQAPVAGIVRPAAGVQVFEREALAIEATASDDVAVASVTIAVDGQPLATEQGPPVDLHHLRRLLGAAERRRRRDGKLMAVGTDEVVRERRLRIGELQIPAERDLLEQIVPAVLQCVEQDLLCRGIGLALLRFVWEALRVHRPAAQRCVAVGDVLELPAVARELRRFDPPPEGTASRTPTCSSSMKRSSPASRISRGRSAPRRCSSVIRAQRHPDPERLLLHRPPAGPGLPRRAARHRRTMVESLRRHLRQPPHRPPRPSAHPSLRRLEHRRAGPGLRRQDRRRSDPALASGLLDGRLGRRRADGLRQRNMAGAVAVGARRRARAQLDRRDNSASFSVSC